MPDATREPTSQEMVLEGDRLMRLGRHAEAAELYRAAYGRASVGQGGILGRIGLAVAPINDTLRLMEILQTAETISPHAFVGAGIATWHKVLPFFEDARFRKLAEDHAELLPLPNWHWNLNTVLWAIQSAKAVSGDFVELGVFRGHTTLFCAEYVGFADWPKSWWLYDTFEGVPDDQLDPGWEKINENLYGDTYSHAEVRERFAAYPNVHVVKGRVPEVLNEGAPDAIAFLHVDLNNAKAEIAGLERLWDRISPGGIIVLDDYGWAASRAQHVAERAWFAERGVRPLGLPTGQGLVIKP